MQGGLRDQLSGLEPELREGEKAVVFASRSRWVLPLDLTRDPRVFHLSQITVQELIQVLHITEDFL